jgi:hypothetical protein
VSCRWPAPWAAEFDPVDRKVGVIIGRLATDLSAGSVMTDLEAWQKGYVTVTPLIGRSNRSGRDGENARVEIVIWAYARVAQSWGDGVEAKHVETN